MKPKHTPGPWEVRITEIECLLYSAYLLLNKSKGECERRANATLIAAAPEMLEALELLIQDDRLMNAMKREQAQAIMNTVRKATGGES